MKAEERREVRDQLRNVPRSALIAALTAVFDVDASAQRGVADDPQDEKLGWFADGVDTAAAEAFAMVMGRPPAAPEPTGAAVTA
jgi:hypothetical protein